MVCDPKWKILSDIFLQLVQKLNPVTDFENTKDAHSQKTAKSIQNYQNVTLFFFKNLAAQNEKKGAKIFAPFEFFY